MTIIFVYKKQNGQWWMWYIFRTYVSCISGYIKKCSVLKNKMKVHVCKQARRKTRTHFPCTEAKVSKIMSTYCCV